jgi:hypothetical protein
MARSPSTHRPDESADPFDRLAVGARRLLVPIEAPPGAGPWIWWLTINVALFTTVFALGPYPVTIFPDDTMYPLVQGDLLLRKDRPYVDYYSMHGPFPYLFSAVAVAAQGISLEAVVLMQSLGAATFGLLMFVIAWRRTHGALAVILAISVELLLLSCTPLGDKSWREFSCAMWYNSVGYVLYSIVFLYMLAPPRRGSSAWRAIDAVIIGTCLAGAFCTKMSFFAPMFVVFLIGGVLWPRNRHERLDALAACAIGAALALALFAMVGGSLRGYSDYLGDISLRVHPLLLSLRFLHYTRTFGVCLAAFFFLIWMARDAGVWRATRREFCLALLMTGALMTSSSTAAQDPEDQPLLGAIPLGVAIAVAAAAERNGRPVNGVLAVSSIAFSTLLLFHSPKNSVLSWVFSHATPPTLGAPVELGGAEGLALPTRVSPELFRLMPTDWANHQAEGLRLLAEFPEPHDGPLFVASDTTALVAMTGRPYARGHVAWWPLILAPSVDAIPLTRPDLLGDATWVLRDIEYPLVWEYLQHHLPQVLADDFERVGERPGWELYRRRREQRVVR